MNYLLSLLRNLGFFRKKEGKRLGECRIVLRVAGLDFDLTHALESRDDAIRSIAKRMLRRDADIKRLRINKKRWKHLEAAQAEDATWLLASSPQTNQNAIYDGV